MEKTSVEVLTRQPPDGRGCGERSEERPYLCTGTSAEGIRIENFLIDPTIPLPPDGWHRGFEILPRNPQEPDGVKDVIIFVGSDSYPAAWDFVEEVRRFGASRKVAPNFPFEKLTPKESRMLFAHKEAIPTFRFERVSYRANPDVFCKRKPRSKAVGITSSVEMAWLETPSGWHPQDDNGLAIRSDGKPDSPCACALQDLAFLAHDNHKHTEAEFGLPARFTIDMPSFSYSGFYPHYDNTDHTEFQAGIFLALPLTHIEFKNKSHKEAETRAKEAGFRTEVLPW